MSGGQTYEDEQVAGRVASMNELKEKECLGGTDRKSDDKRSKKLSKEQVAEIRALEQEVNEYREKLVPSSSARRRRSLPIPT